MISRGSPGRYREFVRRTPLILGLAAVLAAAVGVRFAGPALREARARLGRATVEMRLAEVGPRVEPLWRRRAADIHAAFPPRRVALVVLKAERRVLVFADGALLSTHAVTAASGAAGPKLREGDRQVPEGFYRVESLNPNSRFRLSLRVDYPSARDREDAAADGRAGEDLGGDIMIHGGAASIGCIAVGDEAIEELFWLVATVGIDAVELVLCPDASPAAGAAGRPAWVRDRYEELDRRLRELGIPPVP